MPQRLEVSRLRIAHVISPCPPPPVTTRSGARRAWLVSVLLIVLAWALARAARLLAA